MACWPASQPAIRSILVKKGCGQKQLGMQHSQHSAGPLPFPPDAQRHRRSTEAEVIGQLEAVISTPKYQAAAVLERRSRLHSGHHEPWPQRLTGITCPVVTNTIKPRPKFRAARFRSIQSRANVLAQQIAFELGHAYPYEVAHLRGAAGRADLSALTLCIGRHRQIIYNDAHPPKRQAADTGSGRWTRIEDSCAVAKRVGWCAMRRGG